MVDQVVIESLRVSLEIGTRRSTARRCVSMHGETNKNRFPLSRAFRNMARYAGYYSGTRYCDIIPRAARRRVHGEDIEDLETQ